MISAAQAVALGADIVLVGMSIKTGSEAVDAENVAEVARCVAEKREVGVPIVGEVYPAGHEDIAPEERHEQISIGCRIVAELGVDLVKTFHTGERFAEIVRSTPGPDPRPGVQEAAPRGGRARAGRDRDPRRRPRRGLRPQRRRRPRARSASSRRCRRSSRAAPSRPRPPRSTASTERRSTGLRR